MADYKKIAVLPADRQIHTRIGINLGDIIDDGQRVLGDGVNVAARLQEIAPPGGICISDSARVVIGNTLSVSFQAVGKQQLRNIASKISAHLVINGSDQPQKATREPDDPRLSIAVLPFTSQTGNAGPGWPGFGAYGRSYQCVVAVSAAFCNCPTYLIGPETGQRKHNGTRSSVGHPLPR